jgi:hypothetical protein
MKRAASTLLLLGAASVNAHAADNILHDMAIEFFTDEFVPTLLALATAALREPMTWGVLGAAALLSLLRRHRSSRRPHRS